MMLVVAFSLSPCSLKRDVLEVFDIQHISTLNKVKTTAPSFSGCESFNSSSKISVSKADLLDDELKAEISKEFPENRKPVFFSSVTQEGLTELKDVIWKKLHG